MAVVILLLGLQNLAAPEARAEASNCTCCDNNQSPQVCTSVGCVCCPDQCTCPQGQQSQLTSDVACATTECNQTCAPAPTAPTGPQTQPFQTYSLSNPLKAATAPELIGRFVNMFIGVVGSFALLMFVYGGLTLLTSRGNPEQVQKGKRIFTWAVIGLVVIFTAYIILANVFKIIGATD